MVAGAVGSLWNVQICDHGSPIRLSSEYEGCHIMIKVGNGVEAGMLLVTFVL